MKERIRELRKAEGLTQQEFGERIGLKANAISMIESGKNRPTEAVILAICREFNVREAWLRRGEGEMREPLTRKQEITRFFDECSTLPHDDFRAVIIDFLAATDAAGWAMLEREARRLAALFPAAPPAEPRPAPVDADGLTAAQREELAELERQMRLENASGKKSSDSTYGKTETATKISREG